MLSIGHDLHQSQNLKATLEWDGGITESIFKMFEEKVLTSIEAQKALNHFMWPVRNRAKLYRSNIDFIFCEIFPYFRPYCQQYYDSDDANDMLRNLITEVEVIVIDEFLTNFILRYAIEMLKNKLSLRTIKQWAVIVTTMHETCGLLNFKPLAALRAAKELV